jgi:hypothetical protein
MPIRKYETLGRDPIYLMWPEGSEPRGHVFALTPYDVSDLLFSMGRDSARHAVDSIWPEEVAP